jgi:hypothetical protein
MKKKESSKYNNKKPKKLLLMQKKMKIKQIKKSILGAMINKDKWS